jgi:hypothetical protein
MVAGRRSFDLAGTQGADSLRSNSLQFGLARLQWVPRLLQLSDRG